MVACVACATAVALLDLLGACTGPLAGTGAGSALVLVATLPKGVATAGLFLAWSARLAGCRARTAWTAYAASFALTVLLYLCASACGPVGLAVGALLLPVASGALLLGCRSIPREAATPEGTVVWQFPWRPVVLMVAFSFACRLAINFGGEGLQLPSELGRLCVALVVLACLRAAFDRFDASVLFKVCPAMVVAGLLLCIVGGYFDDLGARGFLVSAGYSGFTLYVYLTLNTVCYRFGASSDWLFGMTRAACLLVGVLSSMVGGWLGAGEAALDAASVSIVCVVATLLVLLSMLLLADRTPVTTWGIRAVRVGSDELDVPRQPFDTVGYLQDRVWRCAMVARHFGLTHREEEVLSLIAQGVPLRQMEDDLSIAHGTLRAHVQHIYAKLGVHSYEKAREVVLGWGA